MVGAQQAVYNLKLQNFTLVKQIKNEKNIKAEDTSIDKKLKLINTKLEGIVCNRKVTFNKKNNSYQVELELISHKKGAYNIIESIPKGFKFSEINSQGAKI